MLDKNIAALMRENAVTVYVTFDSIVIDRHIENDEEESDFAAEGVVANGMPPKVENARQHFQRNSSMYTYVTTLQLAPGDLVVVPVEVSALSTKDLVEIAIGRVISIDKACQIKPESKTKFKWVVSKLDLTRFYKEARENAVIEQTVDEAYRRSLRTSFRDRFLANIPDSDRAAIEAVLRPSLTVDTSGKPESEIS